MLVLKHELDCILDSSAISDALSSINHFRYRFDALILVGDLHLLWHACLPLSSNLPYQRNCPAYQCKDLYTFFEPLQAASNVT